MIVALTVALVLAIAGFLWVLDRRDARTHQERADDREERQLLLQRIQAPEVAVAQHAASTAPADEPFPLSDEEVQDEMEQARAIERLEQIANAEAPWLS